MFTKWIKNNVPEKSTAFELKIVKKGAMPYNAVQEHQLAGLYGAKHSYSYHKLSDMSREKKPYDCYCLAKAEAYLVVWWYKPRQTKEMIWIDIDDLLVEAHLSSRKSLTEERAKQIGKVIPF